MRATRFTRSGATRFCLALGCLMAAHSNVLAGEGDAARSPADRLFEGTNVLVIRIDVPADGMAALVKAHLQNPERPTAMCEVREGGAVFTNVAVHLKGAAGSFLTVDDKPRATVKFCKGGGGQSIPGL